MALTPVQTIKTRAEITEIYTDNFSKKTLYFRILFSKRTLDTETKVLFVVSKKTGNAVKRNRVRRQLKEVCRLHKSELPKRLLAIITYPNITEAKYQQIELAFLKAIKQVY